MNIRTLLLLAILMLTLGCSNKWVRYDLLSVERTVELHYETLALIDETRVKYTEDHSVDVDQLLFKLQTANELSQIRPNNKESSKLWKLINDEYHCALDSWKDDNLCDQQRDQVKEKIDSLFFEILAVDVENIKTSEKCFLSKLWPF